MKTHLKIIILVTVITLSAVDTGRALPLLFFDDNVASDTLIANRESLDGYFDLRSKINGFTNGAQDRYFDRGTLHLSFRDDNDLSKAGHYYSRWERKTIDYGYHFERRRYDILRDPFEMVEINALGTTAYEHTSAYTLTQKSGLPDETLFDDRPGPFDSSYRTEMHTSMIGWGGDIHYSMELDDYWLERISTTGLLNYNLKAIFGDMIFQSASLELHATNQATPVPEPSTFLLVFLSAGIIGGGRMIRKLYGRYPIHE